MMELEILYEAAGLPEFYLPEELRTAYGGDLGLREPCLVANFVATADGVVALPKVPQSNKLIRASSEADLFVMGLLRASADAILVGATTLEAAPSALWTPERAYPPAARAFADLCRQRGRTAAPEVVVLTGSGRVAPTHPLFERGALVLTTGEGEAALAGRLPAASTVVSLQEKPPIGVAWVIAFLRDRGHRVILSEAGPHTFTSLLNAGLVDELFLTVSPLLVGRASEGAQLGLLEGPEFLPADLRDARLLSVRRDGAHLFLRYALRSE
jgi:riboflavin biosynthesis pyrimidine reductase